MEDYRSKSYSDGNMQIQPYCGPPSAFNNDGLRSYSTSNAYAEPPRNLGGGKRSASSKSWGFVDPEFQRKKRVASYKVYSVEGKVKGSFRKSFRWLKNKYTQAVYGWW